MAEELALKKYLQLKLEDLEHYREYLQYKHQHINTYENKANLLLLQEPFTKLLSGHFKSDCADTINWQLKSYETCSIHPEHLIHKSISGNILRSKSEALIDMSLFCHAIPYRYECPLQLDDKTIFPDFTIKHPKSGELYYWEHCGLIEDATYYNDFTKKLNLYIKHDIVPTHNLILTFETKSRPLTTEMIEKNIQNCFGD